MARIICLKERVRSWHTRSPLMSLCSDDWAAGNSWKEANFLRILAGMDSSRWSVLETSGFDVVDQAFARLGSERILHTLSWVFIERVLRRVTISYRILSQLCHYGMPSRSLTSIREWTILHATSYTQRTVPCLSLWRIEVLRPRRCLDHLPCRAGHWDNKRQPLITQVRLYSRGCRHPAAVPVARVCSSDNSGSWKANLSYGFVLIWFMWWKFSINP